VRYLFTTPAGCRSERVLYLEEVAAVRKTLDSRYDDLQGGRVKPIDGEEAFTKLREKSERRRAGG
jgi:hypothetical protein